MDTIIPLYNYRGETPLRAIRRYQTAFPEYRDVPMTYAGRLDPMAEGMLLVLAGDTCKEKETYTGLDKEYIVDILWGISTDAYDVLGCVTEVSVQESVSHSDIADRLQEFTATFQQKYPRFSSKPINGTPMALLARDGVDIADSDIPTHDVTIYSAEIIDTYNMSGGALLEEVIDDITHVQGDFRQEQSIDSWMKSIHTEQTYPLTRIRVTCSSGTYMRQLVHDIGQKMGIPACAYRIYRSSIGDRWKLK